MILLNITRSRMGRLSLCLVWTVVACPFAGADVIPDNITIQTGDTPTLFFRKTGDTTDYWSLSANEASLTLTSTSVSVPVPALRIDHGAPSNSMRLMEAYLGFGTANPQTAIHVVKSAETGAENVARFQVADASVARLDINNATTTAGIFVPRIQGKSDQLFSALTVEALVGDDTGSEPAIVYNSAISTGNQLFNRQLVAFRNNGVAKASIAANGDMTATSFNPRRAATRPATTASGCQSSRPSHGCTVARPWRSPAPASPL